MEEKERDDEKETGRVEALSDGVIAIALLILESKVPKVAVIDSGSLWTTLVGSRQERQEKNKKKVDEIQIHVLL
ncbi:MAG TPA: hypothetical protein VH592_22865 [Gemmataceae bacterium]|jgi:uncharacterized membrane protein